MVKSASFVPPAVLSRRPQRSHLKCLAFWWEMRSFKSSKSRSPGIGSALTCTRCFQIRLRSTNSSSTRAARGRPRRRGGRASSCPSCRSCRVVSGRGIANSGSVSGRRSCSATTRRSWVVRGTESGDLATANGRWWELRRLGEVGQERSRRSREMEKLTAQIERDPATLGASHIRTSAGYSAGCVVIGSSSA